MKKLKWQETCIKKPEIHRAISKILKRHRERSSSTALEKKVLIQLERKLKIMLTSTLLPNRREPSSKNYSKLE
jgi:hypothetical protein